MINKKHLLICFFIFVFKFGGLFLYSKSFVYFSPTDDPRSKLINLINKTSYRIQAAVYMITDKAITQSLVDAKKRGVQIEIVTDKSSLASLGGKIEILKDSGIKIFVFSHHSTSLISPLMHNKFAIFEFEEKGEKWVWTGSYNWTVIASRMNKENVIVTNNKKIYMKYKDQFEELKKVCVLKVAKPDKAVTKTYDNSDVAQTRMGVNKIKEMLFYIKKQLWN